MIYIIDHCSGLA